MVYPTKRFISGWGSRGRLDVVTARAGACARGTDGRLVWNGMISVLEKFSAAAQMPVFESGGRASSSELGRCRHLAQHSRNAEKPIALG